MKLKIINNTAIIQKVPMKYQKNKNISTSCNEHIEEADNENMRIK